MQNIMNYTLYGMHVRFPLHTYAGGILQRFMLLGKHCEYNVIHTKCWSVLARLCSISNSGFFLQSAGSQPLETGVPQKSVGHQPAVEGPLGLNRAWTCTGGNQYAP